MRRMIGVIPILVRILEDLLVLGAELLLLLMLLFLPVDRDHQKGYS